MQPEVQAAQLSSEHGEGEDESGLSVSVDSEVLEDKNGNGPGGADSWSECAEKH